MTEIKPQDPYYYDDVIDLRELVKTLFKFKWIIIVATLLVALTAFVISKFLLPPKYEATAHVGISQLTFEVDLESSINNHSPLDDYRVFIELTKPLPELAESDEVWLSVCEEMSLTCLGEVNDKPELEAVLIGTSQLKLTVTSDDPERSAEFANLWAVEIIKRWNTLYGNEYIDLAQLEEDTTQALETWNTAQNALEDYLPESQINVVTIQLSQTEQRLASYLSEIDNNEGIIRVADSLDVRLTSQNQSSKLLIGDALSLIGLLQRTTGGVDGTQFQLTGTDIYGQEYKVTDARETLKDLISALENQNKNLETQLTSLEAEITTLALEWESEQYRIDLLEQERDRAMSNYIAQARYLDEVLIVAKNGGQVAYCVARAVVPQEDESNTLINTALGGIMGLMLSIGGVFVFAWWTTEEENV